MVSSENPAGKLEEIQILRAIAALLVMLYHLTGLFSEKFGYELASSMFYFGFAGCDLFFVISGFIILYVHERDIGIPSRLTTFLQKRFFRIFPLYWLFTLAIVLVYFLVPRYGSGYEREAGSIINSLLLLPHGRLPILAVGWTLSYEIICYVAFSLAILVSWRVALACALVWQLTTVGMMFTTGLDFIGARNLTALGPWGPYLFSRFNLEFFLGCLIVVMLKSPSIRKWQAHFFVAGCLGMMFAAINELFLQSWFDGNGKFFGFGIPSFCLVLGSGSLVVFNRRLIYRAFVQLGEASYALYLTHTVVMSFSVKVIQWTGAFDYLGATVAAVVTLGIAIATAYGVYRLIDKPLMRYSRRLIVHNRAALPT